MPAVDAAQRRRNRSGRSTAPFRAVLVGLWAIGVSAGALAADDPQFAQGRALFTKDAVPLCAACHTLKDAGSHGEVGPVLDELKPDAARVEKALKNGIGNMPSFRDALTDAQIKSLARYVSKASGGAP